MCFVFGMLWVSIGFIGWGVFLPAGKIIDDVCPMLPTRDTAASANKLLPIILPADMPGRADVLNVVNECLESKRGDLLLLYNVSQADILASFGTHDVVAPVQAFVQANLAGQLAQLGALIAQIKADPNYSTFSNQEAVVNLMARLNDASAGPKLQTDLVAFNAELNSTIYRDVATLLQAGGDCKWAGDDFEAVHLGVCNGIGGSIDIIWFLLLLVSLFMFGYAIVLAKATKRVAEYYGHSGDLETPLLRPDEHRRPHNYAA